MREYRAEATLLSLLVWERLLLLLADVDERNEDEELASCASSFSSRPNPIRASQPLLPSMAIGAHNPTASKGSINARGVMEDTFMVDDLHQRAEVRAIRGGAVKAMR
jgi:hypothetical protein